MQEILGEPFEHPVAPDDGPRLIRHAQALFQQGRPREALTMALRADQAPAADSTLRDVLGTLLTHLGEPARALRHFQFAVDRMPMNIDCRYNLAMAQRMVGEVAAAEANLDAVISARPLDAEAFHARSDLRKQTREHNHVTELEKTLHALERRRSSIPVAFALAKELEDLGEYRRSFDILHKACQGYRASLRYEVRDDVAVLDQLRSAHTRQAIENLTSSFDSEECIFIVGLPRSGTTLVERMVGSHSEVYPAGELDAFPRAIVEAVSQQRAGPVRKLDFVQRSLEVNLTTLGACYLENTRPRTGHTPRFTDKQPLNYLYAGLIHAALPKARFIALSRHPMDVCYAMYRTLFAAAYPFSYDLGDLARYYIAWERLMRHWAEVIGGAWLTVNYEDLVREPESAVRRMLTHCGLPWEPRCLQSHLEPGAFTTASAVQVRRPVHTESMGKWRRYARELEPLELHLTAHGIAIA